MSEVQTTIRRLLPKSQFVRSVSMLAGSTAASQALLILASPVLTRLYSPDDFGLLAVFAALLGVTGVVASFRYQLAIPLPESDVQAAHVAVAGLVAVGVTSTLTALAVVLFGDPVARLVGAPELAPYLWLLPIGVLAMGIYQVFKYWSIRTRAFSKVAKTKLTQSVSLVAVQLGAYALGPVALLVGQVAGQSMGASRLGVLALRDRWDAFKQVRPAGVWNAAVRYKDFPVYSTWGAMFNKAGGQLPPVLFAALFSPAAAGIYFLAHRVLAVPMQLIGEAVADVFKSSAAISHRKGTLSHLVREIHSRLAHIAMPPALVLLFAGPDLFSVVFGEGWRQAGIFAQWMAPWVYLVFITSPLSTLFAVLEKQAQGMFFQVVLLIARVAALLLGTYFDDLVIVVALFALASALCWLGLLIWITWVSENQWTVLISSTGNALLWSAPVVLPTVIYSVWGQSVSILFIAVGLTALLAAGRYAILIKDKW